MNAQKRMRDYAFRQLRKNAAIVERKIAHAIERESNPTWKGLGTAEFWRTQASETAERARKLAVEYAAFIARGSYL